MNGSIELESELGKGSTFTITIPHKIAYKDYTNRNIESSNEFDIDFKGKRILLAEENELNAEITTTILSEMGFKVKAVENGILCVNEMLHQPANTFDLILWISKCQIWMVIRQLIAFDIFYNLKRPIFQL